MTEQSERPLKPYLPPMTYSFPPCRLPERLQPVPSTYPSTPQYSIPCNRHAITRVFLRAWRMWQTRGRRKEGQCAILLSSSFLYSPLSLCLSSGHSLLSFLLCGLFLWVPSILPSFSPFLFSSTTTLSIRFVDGGHITCVFAFAHTRGISRTHLMFYRAHARVRYRGSSQRISTTNERAAVLYRKHSGAHIICWAWRVRGASTRGNAQTLKHRAASCIAPLWHIWRKQTNRHQAACTRITLMSNQCRRRGNR